MQSENTNPSICIPRTVSNITRVQVKDVFETILDKGTVSRVDIVNKTANDGQQFVRIFVHFKYWPKTEKAQNIRQRIVDGETIKIVYDNPWFWKCSLSRVPKPQDNRPKQVPYVEFDKVEPKAVEPKVTEYSPNYQDSSQIDETSQDDLAARSSWSED